MTMKDLHNDITVGRALSPAAAITDNTAQVCQIIDNQFLEAQEYVINIGALADADATFTVLLEDGDDSGLSDAAAVADAFLLGTEVLASFTFADDNETRKLGYIGKKRYTRMTITPADNTGNAFFSVLSILGSPRHAPTSNP